MTNLVLILEAVKESSYTQEHVTWLLRNKKVAGKKVGMVWMVDLDSLKDYESRMSELGTKKHQPPSKQSKD